MKPKEIEMHNPVPYSLEGEVEMLGALMCKNELLERVHFLKANHFHSGLHRKMFEAITREVGEGRMASPLTLRPMFEGDPALEVTGATSYLVNCVKSAATMPVDTARYLAELYQRRELAGYCANLQESLLEGAQASTEQAFSLIEKCEKLIDGEQDFKLRTGEEVCQAITDDLRSHKAPVSTGMQYLDDSMDGGLHIGKSYGFAARKKVGKTILAGTLSYNLAIREQKHLFICGEMSPEEIHQRTLARVGNFYSSAFRSSQSKTAQFAKDFANSVNWAQKNILYSNSPGLTFEKLRRTVKRAIIQHQIKGFILDYWQLVGGKDGKKSTAEHLDEVAQWIADTCRKHRIWSITMAQINQEGNTRGGEGMRLAFDQVYQIHRPSGDEKSPFVWMEMLDTRYTKWMNIGSDDNLKIKLVERGPYFEENYDDRN